AIFFVASDQPELAFRREPDLSRVHPYILREVQSLYAGVVHPAPAQGRILTDDFNPAEFYDARNREDFRRKLALAARQM
ncbi:MAG TPA: spermidine synthase, partial [Verrucomicrobiota bacterium]|nr:spermidine synthase [Verrucomicrobiota bacterium]